MLQQTQVPRVVAAVRGVPRRGSRRRPRARAAPVGDVVAAWAGLGYNRRAVNLHRCAVAVVERHGGRLPDDLDALLALPGHRPVHGTRGARVRVRARHRAGRHQRRTLRRPRARGRALTPREAQALADAAVPAGTGGRGARPCSISARSVCTKRDPRATRARSRGTARGDTAGLRRARSDRPARPASAGRSPRFNGSFRAGSRTARWRGWPTVLFDARRSHAAARVAGRSRPGRLAPPTRWSPTAWRELTRDGTLALALTLRPRR